MSKKKRKILDRSLAWIRANPFAKNLDVPDEFVEEWIFEDDEDPRPSGFYFSVFSFGFLQREVLLNPGLTRTQPRAVPVDLLIEGFQMWQMKLGLVEVHRKTELQLEPLSLFEFPRGEEVRFWSKQPPPLGGLPSVS